MCSYSDSIETFKYYNGLDREREAFEELIHEKSVIKIYIYFNVFLY